MKRLILPSISRLRRAIASLEVGAHWKLYVALGIILLANISVILQPLFTVDAYALGSAEKLLPKVNSTLAGKIRYNSKDASYQFSSADSTSAQAANTLGVQAGLPADITKGISVNDPANGVTFRLVPIDKHDDGKKDGNRVVYPLKNGRGWTVYTLQNTGVKEDVILTSAKHDTLSLHYKMELGDGLSARLESNGSIGVYGNSVLSGSVAAGNEKDAKLLEKARKNAEKDTLLFLLPAPTVIEADTSTDTPAKYYLNGNDLEVRVSGLKKASYPLSIDPTIFVASARQFMAGNNETNINFNVDEQLIEKGRTTGARFDTWNDTTNLPTATWNHGTAAAGGFIYTAGGTTFPGQVFNTQGSSSFTVPAGVTSMTMKLWGGGGGGGGGAATTAATGGDGGGGGYTQQTIAVTPGETLTVYVGGGGGGGNYSNSGNDAGGGGGGGGYSSIYRGSTLLTIAAGGGGGGGARNGVGGAQGGAGGGTSGQSGSSIGGGGGGGGTQSSGGGGGSSGNNNGSAGSSLSGGAGADGRSSQGVDGSGADGGLATGGNGGSPNVNNTRAGGGGGGSGYYGGGGGGASTSNNSQAGGGGGGGSSYTTPGATSVSNTAGSAETPANASDTSRNGAANGGTGGPRFNGGSSGAGGLVIVSYGSGEQTGSALNWAEFNTTTGSIDSANPGSGACSGWCTDSSYNLPSARSNFSLVAYSGYLYAFGGIDSSGNRQNSVYIAKLGANGEPRKWHPTDKNTANWVYWHQDTALPSARSDMGAAAYNNRMYLVGGRNATGPTNTVHLAAINPNGTLGGWTASTNLPANVYGHSIEVYNDRLYVIGGASTVGGTPLTNIRYTKINVDGTINDWINTTSLTVGRFNTGGDFTTVWGAYLYVSGGCSAMTAGGHCSTPRSDTQVASINADGSIDTWNAMAGVDDQRTGYSLLSWRDRIYAVGGCRTQNTTTGTCNNDTLASIVYGQINQDGDASTVEQSVSSGTGTCSGTGARECNLPGSSYIGNMLTSSFIANGHLYVIGGCTNNRCSTTTGNVAYVAINASGQTTRPATCPSGTYQATIWCIDSTNTVSGGLAAASPVIFNNHVYLVGGLDGGGNTNTVVRSSINDDGSLSGWTTQSMTGLGMNSVSYQYATSRANPSSASTAPGNLYVFGGCTGTSGAGCTSYSQNVYKCSLLSSGAVSGCSTSGQLQIGAIPGNTATGLAVMSGTVYANYIYLIGGITSQQQDLKTVRYARFDDNNNVVATSGSSGWTESDQQMSVGRRRAAAFGYNGYLYVVGGYEAESGVLPDIEFAKIDVGDGSLGDAGEGFKVSAVKISQRWGLSVPVSNSYAYIIGGCISGSSPDGCTSRTDVIQTFQIYNNGSGAPAAYTPSANSYQTAPNRIGASSTIHNGHIYTAGGCTSTTDCTATTDDVSYAPINANGQIGTFVSSPNKLPAGRAWGKLRAAGNSLYYIGGQSNSATDIRAEVYYTTPSNGAPAAWATAANGLPAGRSDFGATSWNDRLYVVGGKGGGTNCTNGVCNTIFASPKLSNGGNISSNWSSTSAPFSVGRSGAVAVSYANNLYVLGGYDGNNYLSDVQYSKIDAGSGNAGAWTFTNSLPGPLAGGDGFAANGYVYLIGGRSADTTCNPSTVVAPISANTTIAAGNNPTGVGEWYETNQRYSGARYGNSAVYYDGKAYVVGGACGSTLSYASPAIQQTALLSQPQVAKYSIAVDTDSDVYPSHWLLNGIDNSIGANWQLRYRSMTNDITTFCASPAMTTWGQETVFGNVALGTPGSYVPKNTNGASTNCARYYYFNVTVDSSQAFGYPDDVSRGPTITDLTLQFTADPSKRLLHGRTFTGGLQQPIDTPLYTN